MKSHYNTLNFILFQLGWFACVLGAAHQLPYAGVIYAAIYISIHWWFVEKPRVELLFIAFVSAVGFSLDSIAVAMQLIQYLDSHNGFSAPFWIAALWAMFATTIGHSLKWLRHRLLIAVIAGAVFGPLAYLSAAKLGALQLTEFNLALLYQAIVWATVLPLLFFFHTKIQHWPKYPAAEVS